MKNEESVELSYRTYYGKLFASLIKKFGAEHVNSIEDAIHNAFYQSLKSWKPGKIPENRENWLYIVARNDLLNQLKRAKADVADFSIATVDGVFEEDPRLQTILYLAYFREVSPQARTLFMLKNIFGLQVKEISECTLLSEEAIYKSIVRAKKSLRKGWDNQQMLAVFDKAGEEELQLIEEILYAVFNIGFDSFSEKSHSIVNEDLCLEALALTRLMLKKYNRTSTSNLIALFCFHVSRIPSKLHEGRLLSFYQQDREKWNTEMVDLAFHHLIKPDQINKYYLEALIASKYMVSFSYNQRHWEDVIMLYRLLLKLTSSPVVKLNLCYCYHKANKNQHALALLEAIEKELPREHTYFALVKAHIIKEVDRKTSDELISGVITRMSQSIRKEYLLRSMGEVN
ncbi:RNA polymerase sigma factor [Marivirga lumbricoides]|uniref:RNA polymerase sigma factor n=1 Tax=Marivirga lumbricoides TaxID=1046115 RepID=A0ABQ1LPG4_9BACT|nr:RNA polymerase sigma factor [Marivirga lumbricoides]